MSNKMPTESAILLLFPEVTRSRENDRASQSNMVLISKYHGCKGRHFISKHHAFLSKICKK